MDAASPDRHDRETTLGDVLYANRAKAPVSEKVWVGLVQAIAGGDQRALNALYSQTYRIVFTLILPSSAIGKPLKN